ncbi:hypothetical protein [Nocardia miyunensis]|nr:hypothetical protein [Nocardia miyunensis]
MGSAHAEERHRLGHNSFALEPSAVIGASPGKLGTAIAQLSPRSVLG